MDKAEQRRVAVMLEMAWGKTPETLSKRYGLSADTIREWWNGRKIEKAPKARAR